MATKIPPIANTLVNLNLVSQEDVTPLANQHRDTAEFLKGIFAKNLIGSEKLSKELSTCFGSPLFDLSALDPELIPKELIEQKIVERHLCVPIYKHGKSLFVAMVDPTNKSAIDEVKFSTGLQVMPVLAELYAIEALINGIEQQDAGLEDFLGEDGDIELEIADDDSDASNTDAEDLANEAPIVKYVNKVLVDAINQGVSDIHIEPFEKELRIRYRIDGILQKVASQPSNISVSYTHLTLPTIYSV